jgi:hypothetical protein
VPQGERFHYATLISRILTEKVNTLAVEDFVEIGLEPRIADRQVLLKIDKIKPKSNNFCFVILRTYEPLCFPDPTYMTNVICPYAIPQHRYCSASIPSR